MTAIAVDIAIVGGGLVGSSLALALQGRGGSIALIEPSPPDLSAPPRWDERCIALTAASEQAFRELGVWSPLQVAAAPILATHVSERGRFGVARFTAENAALPQLGWNIPFRHLNQVLWRAAARTGVQCFAGRSVRTASATDSEGQLTLDDGQRIEARLIVAADGAQSPIRAAFSVAAEVHDYAQSAVVSALRVQRSPRGWAYERFLPGGPMALLPKPEDSEGPACSLIWTLPSDEAEAACASPAGEFLAAAQAAFGERLGRFRALGERQRYPLRRVLAASLTAPRTVFVGNAAQSLHPVAAQGFNLGLRDVAELAEVLKEARDPGVREVLDRYARRRRDDRRRTAAFTDGLVRVFSNQIAGLAGIRHLGLLALDLVPPVRDAVLWQNLGVAGSPLR